MKTYCVATAVIQDGDKYFIAKRAKTKKIAPDLWEFVTGFVEDHEAAEDTILREMEEEISATGDIVRRLDIVQFDTGDEHWVVIPFLIHITSAPKLDPAEHSASKWVTWEEFEAMPADGLRYEPEAFRQLLKR